MLNEHEPLLLNAAGHIAGAIIFGIFLALAIRGASARRTRQSLLSVASAALAFLWNAASLAMLVLPPGAARWTLEALSVCALSLLPAVLLHLSTDGKFRAFAAAGYVFSAGAIALHLNEALLPATPLHRWALWTITFGFGGLTLCYAVAVLRRGTEWRSRTPRILASMCLLLFAVTFSHFGAGHPPQAWKELVIHHAGLPIALLILLQDYRFVFLDAFVRFLANVILAAALAYAGLRLAADLALADRVPPPLSDTIVVAALCGLMILFAYLRGIVQRLLTEAVFRGGHSERAAQELRSKPLDVGGERGYLDWAAAFLARAVDTAEFELAGPDQPEFPATKDLDFPALAHEDHALAQSARWNWTEAIVPIRLSHGDTRRLLLGRRRGGRRYLSEDLRFLHGLAAVVSQEVERFRAAELHRLVTEAELRALHSQINPHFLFNALNTIYGIIPREAAAARTTVLHLADIFRYFLQSDKVLIPLGRELKIVRSYLEIERLRLGDRLEVRIDVDVGVEYALIPVLSVQPLVENAIKHGVGARQDGGRLTVRAGLANGVLTIAVEDSGSAVDSNPAAGRPPGAGLGLANLSRRLQLCFGPDSRVELVHGPYGARSEFSIPASSEAVPAAAVVSAEALDPI